MSNNSSAADNKNTRWKLYGDHMKPGFEEAQSAAEPQSHEEPRRSESRPKLSSALGAKPSHHSYNMKSNIRRLSMGRPSISDPNFSSTKYKPSGVKRVFSSRVISSPRYGGANSRYWKSSPSTATHAPPNAASKPVCMPTRVGDFLKVFPFNDVTRKNAAGNLDSRLVIRECFKQLKHRPAMLLRLHEEALISGQTDLLNNYLWPPLKLSDSVDR